MVFDMKAHLSLFFCLSLCLPAWAQKVDSLEAVLTKTTADSSRTLVLSLLADELNRSKPSEAFNRAREGIRLATKIGFGKGLFENYYSLAAIFQGQASFDSAVFYYHRALAIAASSEDNTRQAEVCSGLGHCFMRKSSMDSARYYLDKGLVLAKSVGNVKIEAGIYNNYGNVFLEESNYQKALDYFLEAARLYENPLADDYGQCLAYSNIGNIQYRLGDYDKALTYARQSMAIAKRKSFNPSIGYAHKLLGRIYRKQQKYDSALAEYKEGQKLYEALGDIRSAAEVFQNIGNIYFDKEQHRDALLSYQQSLALAKRISSKTIISFGYSAIGQAYAALKKNKEALIYLDSSIAIAKTLGNVYLAMDNFQAISAIYESDGEYKKALAAHQQFVQLKDSIKLSENRQAAEEAQAKYELEKKESEIALLKKDQELNKLVQGRQRAIQVGGTIALLLTIVIAFLLVHRYREINKAKRLAEIEHVRNAIARDLHDDIGSTLSTINIISNLAIRENVHHDNRHLEHIAEQSSRMMENMTDIVWSINPANDSIGKMAVKMKTFAGDILEPKNIQYRFSGEESLQDVVLDADKRKNLFLIFKEAINNAAKYSNANLVTVTFQRENGQFVFSVKDDGIGFSADTTRQGNGLKNMEARARAIQAQFRLASSNGVGTEINVTLPIT
jgi:two-component system, NarL family, sensor histidine kinase UhpB